MRHLPALAGVLLLAACADPAPPARPVVQAPPPMPAAAPVQMPTGDGRVTTLNFTAGMTDFDAARLNGTLERLNANPRAVATIATYSNRAGMDVARSRARAVRQALLDRGIAPNRVRIVNGGMVRGADADAVQITVR